MRGAARLPPALRRGGAERSGAALEAAEGRRRRSPCGGAAAPTEGPGQVSVSPPPRLLARVRSVLVLSHFGGRRFFDFFFFLIYIPLGTGGEERGDAPCPALSPLGMPGVGLAPCRVEEGHKVSIRAELDLGASRGAGGGGGSPGLAASEPAGDPALFGVGGTWRGIISWRTSALTFPNL